MIVNRKISVTALWLCCIISVSAQGIDSIGWRQVFTEPQLVMLIETALEGNADLRTANLNVVQAEAQLKAARLAFLPSLMVGAEGNLQSTKGQPTLKTYNVPLTMQWEVDLSGRLRGEKRAAVANYWSTAETERAVRLQLIAAVATHYYQLEMMDEQLTVTRVNIENARQTVETMETLKEVGMQNEAAVSAARATWLNIAAQEKTLLQQIQATENMMRVLVGEQLESIGRSGLDHMDLSVNDTTTYRLETLAGRPDVKAAEYTLKAQTAQVDVARAAFYPQLTISAAAGWTNNVGEIVNPGQMLFSAIGSLVQPLFNRGQNRANLRIAKAQQEQALVAFNQTLLVAGTELSYAVQAFRFNSIDYLLKPIDSEELHAALAKIHVENTTDAIAQLLESVKSQTIRYRERFLIPHRADEFLIIPVSDVSHITIRDGVVRLCTLEGKHHTLNMTLEEVESQLDPQRFMRVNRQFIISAAAVQKLSTYFLGKMRIHMTATPDEEIIVSKDKVATVKRWLDS